MCFLSAWRQTGETNLLLEALRMGEALACVQTQGGGWLKAAAAGQECPSWDGSVVHPDLDADRATFDDGTQASALYFAFALQDASVGADMPAKWLKPMIAQGLGFVLASQRLDGSWPQSMSQDIYHPLATLNDDVTTGFIRLLIWAHERNNDDRYLAAAVRGGNYLRRVQGPETQPAFAQQYSAEGKPAAARAFEPAGYASLDTGFAINALLDLYKATGDAVFRRSAEKAAAWLRRSRIGEENWARIYEIGSNEPLYATRAGKVAKRLEELPEDERHTYRWQGGREVFPAIGTALERVERLQKGGLEALRDYDRAREAEAWLAQVPTARIPLGAEPTQIEEGSFVSARRYAVDCAAMLSAGSAAKDRDPGL